MLPLLLSLLFAQTPDWGLQVYPYEQDLSLRDALIAEGSMYEDLGGFLLGLSGSSLAARFGLEAEAIGELPAGHLLAVVLPHHHPGLDDPLLAELGSSLLWSSPDHGIQLFGLPAAAAHLDPARLHRCHGAFRLVRTSRPLLLSVYGGGNGTAAITPDAEIQTWVAQISQQNLRDHVDDLVAFGTRRHGQNGEVQAQNWIRNQFQNMGLATSLFDYDSGADVVIGELRGGTDADKIVVLGGHYDSINFSVGASGPAPGADDDASGTGAVIEIARILSQHNFDFTIRFCAWSGEESGLLGSTAYADHLLSLGAEVVGMVQLDMVAYRQSGDTRSVDFVTNDTTPSLNQFAMDVYRAYVPGLEVKSGSLSGGTSDHRPFFQNGYPACFPFEDLSAYSPFIHTSNDVVGVSANDFVLAEQITQGALATIAELAQPVALRLTHSPLEDTRNDLGPYYPGVLVEDLGGSGVHSVSLHWRVGGAAWTTQAMTPTGALDEWGGAIPGQPSPSTVEYYLTALDGAGRERWLPPSFTAGEASYAFLVGNTERLYFNDFEGATDEGWTHSYGGGTSNSHDDWQRGAPNGKAGDPGAAFSGSKVWGNDIGGSGWNGEYQSDVNIRLISPPIDCSGKSGVRLRYMRHLSVEEGQFDQARLRAAGAAVWENAVSGHHQDSGWVLHDLDISAQADNNPALELRFQLQSDGGLEFGGWNLDDFEVYALSPSDGLNYLKLSGPGSAAAGGVVSYSVHGAPAGAPWWLLYSLGNSGSVISGHDFDLGPGYTAVGSGTTSPLGLATFSQGLPGGASGVTVYLEAASYDAASGSVLDSNLLQLDIQ